MAFCWAYNLSAQQPNVINTAVPFLRLTPDARAAGMGSVGLATSPDVHSIFWNTSKLAFIEKQLGISISYDPISHVEPNGVYFLDASAYWRIDSSNAITGSFRYFHFGELPTWDNGLEYTTHLGYARKLSKEFSAGINVGYVRSNIARGYTANNIIIEPAQSLMGDLSLFFSHPVKHESIFRKYNLGVAISNLGNKISYINSTENKDFLPANLGIGSDFDFQFGKRHQISFALDLNKLLVPTPDTSGNYREESVPQGIFKSFSDAPGGVAEEIREVDISAGAEYWYKKMIALRTGVFYESTTKGGRQLFNVGAALKYQIIQLDVAYFFNISPYQSTWDKSLQFGLSLDLNFHKH